MNKLLCLLLTTFALSLFTPSVEAALVQTKPTLAKAARKHKAQRKHRQKRPHRKSKTAA